MSARLRRIAVLAALLTAAAARADEGAYRTLLSMGRVAPTDRGPDPGPPPEAAPRDETDRPGSAAATSAPRGAAEDRAETAPAAAAPEAASGPAAVDARVPSEDSPRRRRWALTFSALAPPRRRASSFEPPALSTAAARSAPPASAGSPSTPAEDEAARAGARRGLIELFSVSSAPDAP